LHLFLNNGEIFKSEEITINISKKSKIKKS